MSNQEKVAARQVWGGAMEVKGHEVVKAGAAGAAQQVEEMLVGTSSLQRLAECSSTP